MLDPETLGDLENDFESEQNNLMEDIEEGETERGTNFSVHINIGFGKVRIASGVDDGTDSYQAGCSFCLWSTFVAAGLIEKDYGTASKKLASMLKREFSSFKVHMDIEKA